MPDVGSIPAAHGVLSRVFSRRYTARCMSRASCAAMVGAMSSAAPVDVLARDAFDQQDPRRHCSGVVGARPALRGHDAAHRFVGEAQVHARDALAIHDRRQDAAAERFDRAVVPHGIDGEAHRQHDAAAAHAVGERDAADRAGDVAKVRNHALRPRRGSVQPVEVILPAQRLGAVRFVEIEVLGRTFDRNETPSAAKAGDAHTLRHVLAVVPLVEVVARFGRDVVPDGDDA